MAIPLKEFSNPKENWPPFSKKHLDDVVYQIISKDEATLMDIANHMTQDAHTAFLPHLGSNTLNPHQSSFQHFQDLSISVDKIEQLCHDFYFPKDKLIIRTKHLSMGQRQLVSIMLTFAISSDLIVLLNPMTSLDPKRQHSLLKQSRLQKKPIVILNHIELKIESEIIYLDPPIPRSFILKKASSKTPIVSLNQVILPFGTVSPIDLSLCDEITGITGPNGIGKSVLAKAIMQSLPVKGDILIQGKIWKKEDLYQAKLLQLLFQDVQRSLLPHQKLKVILEEDLNQTVFESVLAQFNLTHWEDYYPQDASISVLKTLCLARVIARSPQFLILDEPFSGMDTVWENHCYQVLAKLDIGVLIIDHDIHRLRKICHQIYTLSNEKIYVD